MLYLRAYATGLRPWFWWAAIGPAISGYLWITPDVLFVDVFKIVFILGFCIAGFAELTNEIYDSQYDRVQHQFSAFKINSSGGSGIISSDAISLKASKWLLLGHLSFGSLGSLYFFAVQPFLFGMGMFLAWAYSVKPFRLKENAGANILAKIAGYGVVSFAIGVAIAGQEMTWQVVVLGLLIGVIQCGYNGIADVNDTNTDRLNGIKTLPVLMGPTFGATIYMIFCLFGLFALLIYRVYFKVGPLPYAVILITTLSIVTCASLCLSVIRASALENHQLLARLHLMSGVVMMGTVVWIFSLGR